VDASVNLTGFTAGTYNRTVTVSAPRHNEQDVIGLVHRQTADNRQSDQSDMGCQYRIGLGRIQGLRGDTERRLWIAYFGEKRHGVSTQ